ncbi:MAG: sarcosine oxidase subunit gamma family protein [Pseudomonadota bacterium]
MADRPERISPLHAVAEPGVYGANTDAPQVELSERLCGSLVQVQAWPDTAAEVEKRFAKELGVKPGKLGVTKGDVIIMPTGPGRWLIDHEDEGLEARLRKAVPVDLAAVTGLTHARVVVSLNGPKAAWVMASGVALDFDLSAFPVGGVQVSHHHEIGLTIHRTREDGFDLYGFTSYALGLWHWATHASAEVGYRVS